MLDSSHRQWLPMRSTQPNAPSTLPFPLCWIFLSLLALGRSTVNKRPSQTTWSRNRSFISHYKAWDAVLQQLWVPVAFVPIPVILPCGFSHLCGDFCPATRDGEVKSQLCCAAMERAMEAADLHCDACNQSHPCGPSFAPAHPKGSVCFMATSEAPKVQKSPLVFTSAVSRGHPDLQ